jgi:hypothetical protein
MRNASNALGMSRPAPRPGSPESSPERGAMVTCPHCRIVAAWGSLVQVNVLDGAVLESHLTARPDGWLVDVRACGGCGRRFGRKVRAPGG